MNIILALFLGLTVFIGFLEFKKVEEIEYNENSTEEDKIKSRKRFFAIMGITVAVFLIIVIISAFIINEW